MRITGQVRVLVVDDLQVWRLWLCSALQKDARLQVASQATDGLEALECAESIQPDLILLDIGLPKLNGIDVARRMSKICPKAKVLFVSENRDADVVQAALGTGAHGYVLKSDLGNDLQQAVETILDDVTFLSRSLSHRLKLTHA